MNKKILILLSVVIIVFAGYFTYNSTSVSLDGEQREKLAYETEVESADECSSYEKYDAENSVCYFECDNEMQCREIEESINKEIGSWTDEGENTPVFSKNSEKEEKAESENILAEYLVSTGEKVTLSKGDDSQDARMIWKHLSDLAPDTISDKYIETYQLFDDAKSDTLAFVSDDDGNGKWLVAVNLAGYKTSTTREKNMTLIHELGHIVTLNIDQVSPDISEDACDNFYIQEGCANANSYINEFVKTFWTKAEIEESKDEDMRLFREDKFLTEYASTNPVEDMAESFSYFVIDSRSEGADMKDKKSAFFYQFPEIIALREVFRNGISADILRARKNLE